MKKITAPLKKSEVIKLKVGEEVFLSGIVYTARDQAHKRLSELIYSHKSLPFELKSQVIYYCGPTAAPKNKIIGSCGPTTSSRMDGFTESFLKIGLLGMIGKGRRSPEVQDIIKKYQCIYFIAPSGCGALLAKKVISKKLVCFKDLGPEAVYKLEVKDFPLIVGIDSSGKNIYKERR